MNEGSELHQVPTIGRRNLRHALAARVPCTIVLVVHPVFVLPGSHELTIDEVFENRAGSLRRYVKPGRDFVGAKLPLALLPDEEQRFQMRNGLDALLDEANYLGR